MNRTNSLYRIKKLLIQPGFRIIFLSVFAYTCYITSAIYFERPLFADGANFFIGVLESQTYWPLFDDDKHSRTLANLITQFPLAVLIILGVKELYILKITYCISLYIIPLVLLLYGLFLNKKFDFKIGPFIILSYLTSVLPSEIFILNQAILSFSIEWIVLLFILTDKNLSIKEEIIFYTLIISQFMLHESIIFWGIINSSFALFNIIKNYEHLNKRKKTMLICAFIIGGLQTIFVFYWLKNHPLESQTTAFANIILTIGIKETLTGIGITTIISTALAFSYILKCIVYSIRRKSTSCNTNINRFALLFIFVFLPIALIFYQGSLNPFHEFTLRILIPTLGSLWFIISGVYKLSNIQKKFYIVQNTELFVLCAYTAISGSIFQINNNLKWNYFANSVKNCIISSESPVIIPKAMLISKDKKETDIIKKFTWSWALPLTGIALMNDRKIDKLLYPTEFQEQINLPTYIPFVKFNSNFFEFGELLISETKKINLDGN